MEGGEAKEMSWEEVLAFAGIGQWSEVARHCEKFIGHPNFGENAIQLQSEAYIEMGEPKVAIEKLQSLLQPGNKLLCLCLNQQCTYDEPILRTQRLQ